MRISDWSSDVCSSDLIVADAQKLLGTFDDLDLASRIERGDFEAAAGVVNPAELLHGLAARFRENGAAAQLDMAANDGLPPLGMDRLQAERMFQHLRSEEHTSELQALIRNSYACFCLKI